MVDYIQHKGALVFLCGYTAVFDRPSVPIADNGGLREILREGAFDRIVRVPPLWLNCVVYHVEGGPGLVASTYTGDLKVWTDSYGLAFEAGPLKANLENHCLLEAVASGRLRGCSWLATPADYRVETINGEEFRIIEDFKSVAHIGPVETGTGAYRDAVCWANYEDPKDLTPELRQVIDYWEYNRPAEQQRLEARRRTAIAASARSQRKPARPALSDEEIYSPPPGNLTLDDWLSFGRACDYAEREHNRRKKAARRRQAS